jgi:hypothetical protein
MTRLAQYTIQNAFSNQIYFSVCRFTHGKTKNILAPLRFEQHPAQPAFWTEFIRNHGVATAFFIASSVFIELSQAFHIAFTRHCS